MIKTNRGEICAFGSTTELLADLSVIVGSLNENLAKEVGTEDAKKFIMESVEFGLMSDDEAQTKKKECVDKAACEITEAIDELKELIMKGMMKDGSK